MNFSHVAEWDIGVFLLLINRYCIACTASASWMVFLLDVLLIIWYCSWHRFKKTSRALSELTRYTCTGRPVGSTTAAGSAPRRPRTKGFRERKLTVPRAPGAQKRAQNRPKPLRQVKQEQELEITRREDEAAFTRRFTLQKVGMLHKTWPQSYAARIFTAIGCAMHLCESLQLDACVERFQCASTAHEENDENPAAAAKVQLQRKWTDMVLNQMVLQGATVGPTMVEGVHVQHELESIARTQRQIEAHKTELARIERLEQNPDLWPALPAPGDPSAAAVIQQRHLKLCAADIHGGVGFVTATLLSFVNGISLITTCPVPVVHVSCSIVPSYVLSAVFRESTVVVESEKVCMQ